MRWSDLQRVSLALSSSGGCLTDSHRTFAGPASSIPPHGEHRHFLHLRTGCGASRGLSFLLYVSVRVRVADN